MGIHKDLKVVIGLGKTGFSCIKHFVSQGNNVACVDSRLSPPFLKELNQQFPQIPVFLGTFDAKIINEASELVVCPGVSLKEPSILNAINSGIPAVGDIEIFARNVKIPVIAITGSNGKSTVTTLVAKMAEEAGLDVRVGGNLGTPALDLISNHTTDLYVLELSSFQLETTYSLSKAASTVLNITEDHMDRYSCFEDYISAKLSIYNNTSVSVINRDDKTSYKNAKFIKCLSFGLSEPDKEDFGIIGNCLAYGNHMLCDLIDIKIKGKHNTANALAALALGKAIDLPLNSMLETLYKFEGLEHRCQLVRTINNVNWYNDSKATNVGAANATITGIGSEIKGKIVLIAGGIGKNADFSSLRETVERYVNTTILIGQDALKIESALKGCCDIIQANSMEEAVLKANLKAKSNDAVLLAPFCASLDMFENFEHRGRVFADCVRNLYGT